MEPNVARPDREPSVALAVLRAVARRLGAVLGLGAITTVWALVIVVLALGVALAALVLLQAVIG